MATTTEHLKSEFLRLNRMIAQIETKPQRELTIWSSTLRELRAERDQLQRILHARRQEAGKKVVDFQRWRDGRPLPRPPVADRAFLTLGG
jgi:hypothetical protein